MSFDEVLKRRSAQIGARLEQTLAGFSGGEIRDAMRYAVMGGKRLRGFLVMESAALFGVPAKQSVHAAAAIEALHSYSLVHDDMPCMDDDDLRRGNPAVHVRWEEATAVLVGDALQSLAFELIAGGDLPVERRLELSATLACNAGAHGMVLGQALDIAAETANVPLDLSGIIRLQSLKTGALIGWAATAGPVMASKDATPLKRYANNLGLAFQIVDDILDVEGDEEKTGKRVRKDQAAGKATFVSLLGLEGAKSRARELVAEAIDALCIYDARADTLRDAARFVNSREF